MACGGIDPQNIYLWSSLAGILLGGGFSFIIAPSRRRNAAAALTLFSAAVLSALCGVIFGGLGPEYLSIILIWFGIAAAAGFLAFFFWKIVGIPLFFIVVILTAAIYYSLYDWSCLSPGAEMGRIVMLSEGEDALRIQYENCSGERSVELIPGRKILPVVEKLEFPDYFFIVSEDSLIKFHGFTGDTHPENGGFEAGILIKLLLRLPGFSHGAAPAESFRPYPSVDYSLSMSAEGRPIIVRVIE